MCILYTNQVALPLNIRICRNDTQASRPAFKEYIHAHFFYSESEFTSIYKKCTRFLASAAMYMTSALLYSTLPNRTVESQISETYIFFNYIMVVRDCDFLWESDYINFEKMCGRSTCVWCSICNMTRFTILTFVPRAIYGMCINSNLSYTSITSHANGVNI